MDFRIRTAGPAEYGVLGDLTALAYLEDGLLAEDDPYVAKLRDAAARAEGADLLVAVDGDETLLGTVTYVGAGGPWAEISRADEAEFRMLAVDPAAQRRGVARALVRACIERAEEYAAVRRLGVHLVQGFLVNRDVENQPVSSRPTSSPARSFHATNSAAATIIVATAANMTPRRPMRSAMYGTAISAAIVPAAQIA